MRSWVGWIVLMTFVWGPLQASGQNETLVLEGGTLIDGTGRTPLGNPVVVIEGGRIKAVGTKGQVTYSQNARVINTDGRTILPGLIDSHIHLRDWMPQMFLRYGVTTVADTNNHKDWILLQREAWNSGKIKGPRLFVTGMAVAGPTYSPDDTHFPVNTAEEARAFVKNAVDAGVDMIKVDHLPLEQLKAVMEEASKNGVTVVGHSYNIRKAAQVGLKFMEHAEPLVNAILEEMGPEKLSAAAGEENPENLMHLLDTGLYDPLIQLMVKQGVFINPTFVGRWRFASPRGQEWVKAAGEIIKDPALAFVPSDIRQSWTRVPRSNPGSEGLKKIEEFTRKYAEAGGKVVAGTDAGYIPGLSLNYEMQMIADAGVPPMKVIMSATKWAAEVMGKDKDLGTVEPGKLADITVIEGDPLADIAAAQNVRMVIKDGKVVDTSYDPMFRNPVPRPVELHPTLSALNPRIATQGSPNVTLQIEGRSFNPKSVVRFDNADLPTQFVSDTKLTATVASRLLQNLGAYAVYVVNSGSGGGVSDAIYFLVNFKD